ncbi:MAG TPA: hypothetical protein VNM92_03740 [Thermoanaerobaculia bacterium]|nr:hypothetical protein [Thermoanaerobaculia bacterium]
MNEERVPVVLHLRAGKTERVMISPRVDNENQVVTITREDKSVEEIAFSALKAVFFLRDPNDTNPPHEAGEGSTLAVEFRDGEVIRGRSQEYNPERNGFFLYPLDRSKSEKIFIVNSAIVSIEIEKF